MAWTGGLHWRVGEARRDVAHTRLAEGPVTVHRSSLALVFALLLLLLPAAALDRVVQESYRFRGFLPYPRYAFLNVFRPRGGGLEH
jgi:hypothetical protein